MVFNHAKYIHETVHIVSKIVGMCLHLHAKNVWHLLRIRKEHLAAILEPVWNFHIQITDHLGLKWVTTCQCLNGDLQAEISYEFSNVSSACYSKPMINEQPLQGYIQARFV